LNAVPLSTLLALLRDRSGLLLLGLDANAGALITFSGRFYPVRSVEDVLGWLGE
jgi:hypothetical protein